MNNKIDVNLMNKTLLNFQKNYDIEKWFDFWFEPYEFYEECDKNIDISVEKTSLYRAIEIGNIEIVNLLLLNDKIDVNIKNKYHKFIDLGYGANKIGVNLERTALNLAIINDNVDIVKLLLNHNSIDINLSNNDMYYANDADDGGTLFIKSTPLVYAIEKNNVEIVKILLMNNKINVNIKLAFGNLLSNDGENYDEFTPLSVAIRYQNVDIVNLLLMNNQLDLNSSSINFKIEEAYDYDNFWEYGKRKEFTKAYEQPYMKRFKAGSEEKNSDLLKMFVSEKNIDLDARIKKLLE